MLTLIHIVHIDLKVKQEGEINNLIKTKINELGKLKRRRSTDEGAAFVARRRRRRIANIESVLQFVESVLEDSESEKKTD